LGRFLRGLHGFLGLWQFVAVRLREREWGATLKRLNLSAPRRIATAQFCLKKL
jgi:hypothetical protein